jgi:L-fuculose-phosphate aldolase
MNWMNEQKEAIAETCRKLYERGYLVATSGNVSVRNEDRLLITPRATRKDRMSAELIVECDLKGDSPPCHGSTDSPKGTVPSLKPSTEIEMHLEVYRQRGDVHAAIHAHPPYCTACSLASISLTEMLLPELAIYIGPVPTVPYATPGTRELPEALKPFLRDHNAFLLMRHGILVLGSDLEDTFNRLEQLEYIAHVAYLVGSMGSVNPLTKAELLRLTSQGRRIGLEISKRLLTLLE